MMRKKHTEDKIKKMIRELSNMTSAEKWELIEKSFGMWSDYPDDWLGNLRSGNLKIQGISNSISEYPVRKVKAYLRRDSDTKINVVLSNDKFKSKELISVVLTSEMIGEPTQ